MISTCDLNLPIAIAGCTLATFLVLQHWLGLQLGSRRSPIRSGGRAAATLPEQGGKPIALRFGRRSFESLR
jgi:hypothetical protein